KVPGREPGNSQALLAVREAHRSRVNPGDVGGVQPPEAKRTAPLTTRSEHKRAHVVGPARRMSRIREAGPVPVEGNTHVRALARRNAHDAVGRDINNRDVAPLATGPTRGDEGHAAPVWRPGGLDVVASGRRNGAFAPVGLDQDHIVEEWRFVRPNPDPSAGRRWALGGIGWEGMPERRTALHRYFDGNTGVPALQVNRH